MKKFNVFLILVLILSLCLIPVFADVQTGIPAIINGLKTFTGGIVIKDPNTASIDPNGLAKFKNCQVNGATVATLDPNSKVPLTNIYPPEITVELADDATVTLPTITTGGILNVWTSSQYAEYFLKSDGTVEYIRMTSGCDDADTDVTTICVYDGGTNSVLKNRSGGTLTYGYTLIKN